MNGMRFIDRIGVELEGSWHEAPPLQRRLKGDASVRTSGRHANGEMASAPLRTTAMVRKFILENHPHVVDESCGLHVHMSFRFGEDREDANGDPERPPRTAQNAAIIGALGDSDASMHYILSKLEEWGRATNIPADHGLWTRLKGENQYCRKRFLPASFISKGSERYCVVNFDAYERHGTVEIRVLPMFAEPETTLSAVMTLTQIVDDYLASRQIDFADDHVISAVQQAQVQLHESTSYMPSLDGVTSADVVEI